MQRIVFIFARGLISMKDYKPNDEWPTFESNVQAYRSNFLSSQSILLAVGALTYASNHVLTAIIAFIAVFQIWYIWFRTIYITTQGADYHKYAMNNRFDEDGNIKDENVESSSYLHIQTYVSNKTIRQKVYENMREVWEKESKSGKFHTIRLTRFKFDVLIPAFLTFIWLLFIWFSFINAINN